MKEYILTGVIQSFNKQNTGRIYPRSSMDRELLRLSEMQDKIDEYKGFLQNSTYGAVTKLGDQLYTRFGASDEEVMQGCLHFAYSDDLSIKSQALRFIILGLEKKIKNKHL